MKRFFGLFAILALAIFSSETSALAQSREVTCTGTLVDVWLKPRPEWPLAVIYDVAGGYTCTIDRSGSGHDPLRPCSFGSKCRVVGTYRKFGEQSPNPTYVIQTISELHEQ